MAFSIQSSEFDHGASIPTVYTCMGEDISPPLSWKDVPAGTRSLALIVHDPDVPDPDNPVRIWVHWVLYNMPADVTALAENTASAELPPGTLQGMNDWNRTGYGGPCPPIGRHRYFFRLYALDAVLDDLHQPDKDELEEAMRGHIIAEAELVGTYQK
jgi:Raf kinase inhibitor-like YbhB/YbcL family protein